MENKKSVSIFVMIIFVVIALAAGFFIGQWSGEKQGTEKLQPIVDAVFPEPPAHVGNLTGIIKEISGATIALEINSLDDYLPHLDGSPRKTEIRLVVVTPATNITATDMQTGGSKKISLQDLKAGDTVAVSSLENIRDAKKFDASAIGTVK